jgi:molecular chaperone DnaK
MPPGRDLTKSPTLAIDLGFCTTELAVLEGGRPVALPLRGSVILRALGSPGAGLPSVAHVTSGGELVVGEEALAQLVNKPRSTLLGVPRLLGLSPEALTGGELAWWSGLALRAEPDGSVVLDVDGKTHGATALVAALLRRAREGAEAQLGVAVDAAVIAVDGAMSKRARAALADASRAAGLAVRAVVEAPLAVAHAYRVNRGAERAGRERVAVVRFGGGSVDVALLSVSAEGVDLDAQRSEPTLGGAELDSLIAAWLVERTLAASAVDLRREPASMRRLAKVAEEARISLSTRESAELGLPFLSMGPKGPVHVAEVLTRTAFEELAREPLERVLAHARALAAEARLEGRPVDRLLLVGGVTRAPLVRRELEAAFGRAAEQTEGFEPVGAIARGAALFGALSTGEPRPVKAPRKRKT